MFIIKGKLIYLVELGHKRVRISENNNLESDTEVADLVDKWDETIKAVNKKTKADNENFQELVNINPSKK